MRFGEKFLDRGAGLQKFEGATIGRPAESLGNIAGLQGWGFRTGWNNRGYIVVGLM
jgi:hypothetical protein